MKERVQDTLAGVLAQVSQRVLRGESGPAEETAVGVLQFWVIFTTTWDGQERAAKTRGLFRTLLGLATGEGKSPDRVRIPALLVLRNIAHWPEAKVHFLGENAMDLLLDSLTLPDPGLVDEPDSMAPVFQTWEAVGDMVWALLYASQKVKVWLKKSGAAKRIEQVEAYIWRHYGNALREATPELAATKAEAMSRVAWYASLDAAPSALLPTHALPTLVNAVESLAVILDLLRQAPIRQPQQ